MRKETNKWKYSINIKDSFKDETTPELVAELCEKLISQLNKIKEKVAKSNLTEDEKYEKGEEIDDLIGQFEFTRDLANGTISESEWDNYEFDGDFEQLFNDYMSELYDLGDKRVLNVNDEIEKFIWVN